MLSPHHVSLVALFLSATAWSRPALHLEPANTSIIHARDFAVIPDNWIASTLQKRESSSKPQGPAAIPPGLSPGNKPQAPNEDDKSATPDKFSKPASSDKEDKSSTSVKDKNPTPGKEKEIQVAKLQQKIEKQEAKIKAAEKKLKTEQEKLEHLKQTGKKGDNNEPKNSISLIKSQVKGKPDPSKTKENSPVEVPHFKK